MKKKDGRREYLENVDKRRFKVLQGFNYSHRPLINCIFMFKKSIISYQQKASIPKSWNYKAEENVQAYLDNHDHRLII